MEDILLVIEELLVGTVEGQSEREAGFEVAFGKSRYQAPGVSQVLPYVRGYRQEHVLRVAYSLQADLAVSNQIALSWLQEASVHLLVQ